MNQPQDIEKELDSQIGGAVKKLASEPQDEWEKEFLKFTDTYGLRGNLNRAKTAKELKQYISTNFISKAKLKEVIERMGRPETVEISGVTIGVDDGYNQALSDLKKEIDI